MSFDSPLLLALLAVPVAALLGYVLAQRRTARHAVVFPNLWVLEAVIPQRSQWRRHVPAALLFVTLVALTVAAARPTVTGTVARRGATVVLVVDVSGSMRATDVKPSRIEAARRAMLAFVDHAPRRLRIGVIAFSSEPSVITPPTTDHRLVRDGIRSIVPGARTAIGDALARAVELARSAPDGSAGPSPATGGGKAAALAPAAILLLSDGAQTSGFLTPEDAAAQAKAAAVKVNTVALGTPGGTVDSSQLRGGGFRGGGFRGGGGGGGAFNGGGQRIPVPPDPETLQLIAYQTGGKAFTAETSSRLSSIYADLGKRVERIESRRELTIVPLAVAIVLLLGAAGHAVLRAPRLP